MWGVSWSCQGKPCFTSFERFVPKIFLGFRFFFSPPQANVPQSIQSARVPLAGRLNKLPPSPPPHASVPPPHKIKRGGGDTLSLVGRGWGEPIQTKGQTLMVLYSRPIRAGLNALKKVYIYKLLNNSLKPIFVGASFKKI
jgi:hypothetical protein